MDNVIEMSNIEIFEFCKLDLNTGEKSFYENYHDFEDFNGFYFKDEKTFFAIFASSEGPKLYFKDRQYDLKKNLHITLKKNENSRDFRIEEYNISINYRASTYIGFDVWSDEKDVDLFYQIVHSYKDDEYYKKFTKAERIHTEVTDR